MVRFYHGNSHVLRNACWTLSKNSHFIVAFESRNLKSAQFAQDSQPTVSLELGSSDCLDPSPSHSCDKGLA